MYPQSLASFLESNTNNTQKEYNQNLGSTHTHLEARLGWLDWYRGYRATTPCAPRP
jgi:hypothetical protein